MKSVTLDIDGMHCAGCAGTVRALLLAEEGVRAAEVSLEERRARALFDPKVVSVEHLAAAIERAGYVVTGRGS